MKKGVDIKAIKTVSGNSQQGGSRELSGLEKLWNFLNKDIQLRGGGVPDKIKEAFYSGIVTLLESGVDIKSALELVRDEQVKTKYRKIYQEIISDIVNGHSLASAVSKTARFSSYECLSIRIGEETGRLTKVLKELAQYHSKKISQKRQLLAALVYPFMVLGVAFSVVYFMISYVVPMFSDVFKRFGGELPLVTRIVIRFSGVVGAYGKLFFLSTGLLIIFLYSQNRKQWYRAGSSHVIQRLPFLSQIIAKIYIARFSNTMSLLIAAKIPILQALQMTRQVIGFYPIEKSIEKLEADILAGQFLHKSLARFPIYPQKMIALVKVGEEVNKLDIFFDKVAEQYTSEVEYQITIFGKFIEPLIIVILGIVVGVILISMYLPLFKMGNGL